MHVYEPPKSVSPRASVTLAVYQQGFYAKASPVESLRSVPVPLYALLQLQPLGITSGQELLRYMPSPVLCRPQTWNTAAVHQDIDFSLMILPLRADRRPCSHQTSYSGSSWISKALGWIPTQIKSRRYCLFRPLPSSMSVSENRGLQDFWAGQHSGPQHAVIFSP